MRCALGVRCAGEAELSLLSLDTVAKQAGRLAVGQAGREQRNEAGRQAGRQLVTP